MILWTITERCLNREFPREEQKSFHTPSIFVFLDGLMTWKVMQRSVRRETPMAPAMPCKISKTCKHGETRGKTNEFKSKLACILEASESTRLRMEESLPNYHEDQYCRKREQFTATLQFGAHIYSYSSSHENSCRKGSSG